MTKYKLEYIWLDGYTPTPNLRGKTQIKEFDSFPTLEQLPLWGFDGSSTLQAEGHNSDCVLKLVDEHLDLCLAAGINHEGINAEVAKGQWEFQIFGKGSKRAADEMWMARYLMLRLTEKYGVDIEFHCKPLGDTDWNGSGMHANFSTEYMRTVGGKEYFEALMAAFDKNIMDHIAVYGPDNDKRLTGKHETAPWNKFSYGIADRGASIRVPHSFMNNGYKGYLEDRRPNSQGDPYQIASQILKTIAEVPTGAKAAAA